MEERCEVTLFQEITEGANLIRAHVVTVGNGACFVIQVFDRQTGLPLHEEVCQPLKHGPEPFIHTEDLLALEEKTDEILRRLPARRAPRSWRN